MILNYRFFFSAVFSLFILFSKGQVLTSGVAHYVVKTIEEKTEEGSKDIAKALEPFASEISKGFLFTLKFNKDVSEFTLEETEVLKKYSKKSLKLSLIQYGYADTVWQQNNLNLSKTFEGFEDKMPALIKENLQEPKWKITKEKKQIDKFTCYKATKTFIVKRGKKVFSTPMIAWFCPDLPVPFGPLNFGGLPGLVLEAQTNKYLYGLVDIQFLAKNNEIKIPNLPRFTDDELIERFKKRYKK